MGEIDYSKPFKVRIVQDGREKEDYGPSGNLDGVYGICLGIYKFPNTWEKIEDLENRNPFESSPLIMTEQGDYIWGFECYWDPNPEEHKDIPLDLQQKIVEKHKEQLREHLDDLIDPSLN